MELTFTNIAAKYKSNQNYVLSNVNGKIAEGKLTLVMGPRGSGKSTLLNVLAGYVDANLLTEGEILLNGKERNENFLQKVGFLYEKTEIKNDFCTVNDFLFNESVGKFRNQSKNKIYESIDHWLKKFNMKEKKHVKLCKLNINEKKVISIINELIGDTNFIFLEEPIKNFEPEMAKIVLKTLKFAKNKIVVIEMENPSEAAAEIADELIFLDQGKSIYSGKLKNIINYFEGLNIKKPENLKFFDFVFELLNGEKFENELFKYENYRSEIKQLEITNSSKSRILKNESFCIRVVWTLFKNFLNASFSFTKKIQSIIFCLILICEIFVIKKSENFFKPQISTLYTFLYRGNVVWFSSILISLFISNLPNLNAVKKMVQNGNVSFLEIYVAEQLFFTFITFICVLVAMFCDLLFLFNSKIVVHFRVLIPAYIFGNIYISFLYNLCGDSYLFVSILTFVSSFSPDLIFYKLQSLKNNNFSNMDLKCKKLIFTLMSFTPIGVISFLCKFFYVRSGYTCDNIWKDFEWRPCFFTKEIDDFEYFLWIGGIYFLFAMIGYNLRLLKVSLKYRLKLSKS